MIGYKTNNDKMLTAVLLNQHLMEVGGYSEKDFTTFDQALVSLNPIVRTVARIIQGTLKVILPRISITKSPIILRRRYDNKESNH